MPDFLGVSIGRECVEIATLSCAKGVTTVKSFARHEYGVESSTLAERASFAAGRVAESSRTRPAVAIVLPGEDVVLQPQSVPFARRSHISRTLRFDMEDKLPFDVEEGVLDFEVISPQGSGSRILLAAMRTQDLDAIIRAFAERGLAVRLITADTLAASAVAALTGTADYTLINVELSGWKVAVVRRGQVIFARATPAAPASESVESSLAAWLRQSLMAAQSDLSTGGIIITGAASEAIDCETLGGALAAEVTRLELPQGLFASGVADAEQKAASLSPAAVLAAGLVAAGAGGINLLTAAVGEERIAEKLFRPIALGLALATAFLAVVASGYYRRGVAYRARESSVRASELLIWESVFPEREPPGGSVRLGLESAVRELKESQGREALGRDADWFLRALLVLSESVPPGTKPTFGKFGVKGDRMTVSVISDETASGYDTAYAINDEGTFTAEVKDLETQEDGRTTCTLVIAPKGAENAT